MKLKLNFIAFLTLILVGCTGSEIKIRPENSLLDQRVNESYSAVGLLDVSTGKNLPSIGNLTEAFSHEIRASRVAKDVYYPARPDDKTEVTFESKFNSEVDTHSGSTFAKSFLTGFTFFILEPIFWYDFDYKLSGTVDVLKDGIVIKQSTAVTDATISVKWLSLGDVTKLESDAISQAKKSLFHQLLSDVKK